MKRAVGSSDPTDTRPARGAQCIRQRSTLPAVDAPDVSCSRYDIDADINTIFQEELFTDATVAVQGRVWHVHRAILASASPMAARCLYRGQHPVCLTVVQQKAKLLHCGQQIPSCNLQLLNLNTMTTLLRRLTASFCVSLHLWRPTQARTSVAHSS